MNVGEAALFPWLLGGWIALAAVTFVALFFVTAPYGRHRAVGRGPMVNATLGWVVMESPSVLVPLACFLVAPRPLGAATWALFALWQLHYVHRAFIFPFRRRGGQPEMALSVMLTALVFTGCNGYLNGRYLSALGPPLPAAWLSDPRLLVGGALFLLGFAINQQSDWILFHLRRPGETGYKIPQRGLYRFVSCPNYFGEVIEWSGWAIATWSLPGLAFALWTVANLVPRARVHHRWYRHQFADYPPHRRAIIPFLY